MTEAVIPQIGAGLRIVGTIGLHAIRGRVIAFQRSRSSVIIILIVVLAWRAIIAVAVRSDNSADDPAGNCTRDEAAAVPMAVTIAATVPGSTAAANVRLGLDSTRAAEGWRRRATTGAKTANRRTASDKTSGWRGTAATNAGTSYPSRRAPVGWALREACGRRSHRQNQSQCYRGKRPSTIHHCRLRFRD
jgi:hypothetical protein